MYGANLDNTGSEEQNKELEDELERIRFCGDLWERGGRVYRRRRRAKSIKATGGMTIDEVNEMLDKMCMETIRRQKRRSLESLS